MRGGETHAETTGQKSPEPPSVRHKTEPHGSGTASQSENRIQDVMLCKKPYSKGNLQYGCGQCTHCRINRARLWVGRMLLESYEHPASAFITLTYNEEHLPNPPYLDKRHLQLFFKKLRTYNPDRQFRYFAVGEYGDKSWRPHFHLILYGCSPTEGSMIARCWKNGFVHMGTLEPSSCSYVASYVVKKMTNKKDARLQGRTPEFTLMSRNPAIGTGVVERIARQYESQTGLLAYEKTRWPSTQFRAGAQCYPLGTTLSQKLYTRLGLEKTDKILHTEERSRQIYDVEAGQTASELAARRKAKLDQQNAKVRMKRRTL